MSNLDHLVVGVDGSTDSESALRWVAAQAPQRLTLVHGFSPGLELLAAGLQISLDPVRAEHDQQLAQAWSEPARDAGCDVDTVLVDDNPMRLPRSPPTGAPTPSSLVIAATAGGVNITSATSPAISSTTAAVPNSVGHWT